MGFFKEGNQKGGVAPLLVKLTHTALLPPPPAAAAFSQAPSSRSNGEARAQGNVVTAVLCVCVCVVLSSIHTHSPHALSAHHGLT